MSVADHANVAEWSGTTASHAFTVEVTLQAGGVYQAEIQIGTLPTAQPLRLTRQRIAALCGEILNFRESKI